MLIGHSMGGYVALAFVRQYPEMASGLVLVGTKAGKDTPEAAAARRATASRVRAKGVQVVIKAMASKMLAATIRIGLWRSKRAGSWRLPNLRE